MNVSILLNQKNTILAKETPLPEKDKQVFTEILNKEKKNSVNRKQNTFDRSANDGYDANKSSRDMVNQVDTSNQQSGVAHKDTGKLSSKETKKIETDEATKESAETLKEGFLEDIISLLQSLLANIPVDEHAIENESNLKMDLDDIEIKGLVDLKDQLSLLLGTMNLETEPTFVEDAKATLSRLTNIIYEAIATNSNVISVEKESISKVLSSLEDIKDRIEGILNNINSTKVSNLQNVDINKNKDLVEIEEENLSKEDSTLANSINASDKGTVKIKTLDQSGLSRDNEDPNFFQQNEIQELIGVNDLSLIHI
jgi:hypothetical protein